jgi:hypothetical protein
MENWQFLIQKQGERSWRPLESPHKEIIEGRYRVVARSNFASKDVEVRITHNSSLEIPPKRRIQKRSRRINSEGLVAVIPFTYLKPGIWELSCSGDLMSDFLGKPWQHSVQLQVLPKVAVQEVKPAEGTRELGDKEELSVFADELPKQQAIIEQPISPVWLKGETAEQILQNLIELALPPSELSLEDDKTVEDSPAGIAPPLVLKLQEEIYIACWGETLTINGYVEQKKAPLDPNQRVYGGEIRLELRSPQGSEIIRRVRQSLPEKLIPFNIRCSVEIPADCESKLILGEISLYGILTMDGNVVLLANQSFTITADVTELLAMSGASHKSKPDTFKDGQVSSTVLATLEAKKPSVPLDLKLFNLVKTPKKVRPLLLQPSSKKSLPPKINPQPLGKSAVSPQLPRFAQRKNKMISPAESEDIRKPESSDKDSAITTLNRVAAIGTTFPYLKRIKGLQNQTDAIQSKRSATLNFEPLFESHQDDASEIQNQDGAQLSEDIQSHNESFDDAALSIADNNQSQDISFSELDIPSSSELITTNSPYVSPLIRKWMHTQGYSLPEPINLQNQDYDIYTVPSLEQISIEVNAKKEDTETLIKRTSEESDVVGEQITPLSLPSYPRDTLSSQLAQEIVIDDTFDEAELLKKGSQTEEVTVSDVSLNSPLDVEITEPLPVPQLHLPPGELICGQTVRVRVQLAQVCPQLAVKLWVEDCQTRWLIDGPRLLTNLLPNSSGGMEEITHINVPFGCLEIRLEAIALNMATQQESHKATIQQTVIPPNLPTLQLDELLGI